MTQPAKEDATLAGSHRPRRLIPRLWALLLAAAWAGLSVHPDHGSDVFFHLMLGREVLRAHARVVTERWALPGMHPTCAVPEWLWDTVAFVAHRTWGWAGVACLVVMVAAIAAWACCRLAEAYAAEGPHAAIILVTACISPLVVSRLQGRPDAAVMALVPCVVLAAEGLARATAARGAALAAVLVGLVLVWAQIHPSFLLAPVLIAIVAGDRVVRTNRPLAGLLAVALAAALLTSAQGADVVKYTLKHANSYTVSRVIEWQPLTWDRLDPTQNLFLPLYAALWVTALVGVGRSGRLPRREMALALAGLLLALRGQRNLGIAAELLVPLAVIGCGALVASISRPLGLVATFAAVILGATVLARTASTLDLALGPLGVVGPAEGLFPARAAVVLAQAPAGTRVMTSYDAGAPLAFWLDGHVRTSLDARTLLYFDDPEYAAARASWEDPGALDRSIEVYALDAAVVDRAHPVCGFLAARTDWDAIVIDASHTTFARKALHLAQPVVGVAPCGEERFLQDACNDGGAEVTRELDAWSGNPFIDTLRVEARLRCIHGPVDADVLVAMLPSRARSAGFLAERDGVLASILASAGRVDDAVALVAPYVRMGDARAAERVAWALDRRNDPRLRPILERLVATNDEATLPRWVYALLANACAREGKLDCAATYGIFAAAAGEARARPALCTVSKEAPDPITRREARQWLDALTPPNSSPSIVCP